MHSGQQKPSLVRLCSIEVFTDTFGDHYSELGYRRDAQPSSLKALKAAVKLKVKQSVNCVCVMSVTG